MTAELLRDQLARLQGEARFLGRPYPTGIEPFSRVIPGQGFFPGGDGLWRDDEPAALRQPSPHEFPRNGIMFLGNDFGSLTGFQRCKLHENPPTWGWLRRRLLAANIPGHLGFYTNAYLGLRSDRAALAHPIDDPRFAALCGEYLAIQIRHQSPRLIVVLGSRPAGLLAKLVELRHSGIGVIHRCVYEGRRIEVVVVTHPYSDRGKDGSRREAEGAILARAWAEATDA